MNYITKYGCINARLIYTHTFRPTVKGKRPLPYHSVLLEATENAEAEQSRNNSIGRKQHLTNSNIKQAGNLQAKTERCYRSKVRRIVVYAPQLSHNDRTVPIIMLG